MIWITSVWLFICSFLVNPVRTASSGAQLLEVTALYALAIAPLFGVLMLCAESITAYARMRGYAWAFHMRTPSDNQHFDELVVVLWLLLRTILASSTAAFVAAFFFHGLEGDALTLVPQGQLAYHLLLLGQCVYFGVTTMATVGYGDISPANPWGQFVALMMILDSFSLITLVLASLSALRAE